MCLNADECKVMRLSKKVACDGNTPSYKIFNSSLSVVQNYKYSSVVISSNLKWNDRVNHVNHVASRTSRLVGFIKALSMVMTLLFYLGFIKPCAAPLLSMVLQHDYPINRVTKTILKKCRRGWDVHAFQHLGGAHLPIQTKKLGLSSLENRFHYLATAFVSKCLYRVYDVDPFVYVRINIRHTDIIYKIPLQLL